MKPLTLLLIVCPWIAALFAGCASPGVPQRFEFTRLCMGVQCRIVFYGSDEQSARDSAAAAFSRINELEDALSDYRPLSEASRLTAGPANTPVHISAELFKALRLSAELARATNGAFDPTLGAVTRAQREGRPPTPSLRGMHLVQLNPRARSVTLLAEGLSLDFGGIGKGIAADEASSLLRRRGHASHLVALAGDVAAGDPPPGKAGWEVAVIPFRDLPSIGTLLLSNAAVSTSGDTEQHTDASGRRLSHILDGRTAAPVTDGPAVTVVSHLAADSDPIATILHIDTALAKPLRTTGRRFASITLSRQHRTPRIDDPHALLRWAPHSTPADDALPLPAPAATP